jgi:PIN domain nuclease of toxin-antitoxin system
VSTASRSRRPIVFDSSLIIDFVSGNAPFGSIVAGVLIQEHVPIVLSTVTIAEAVTRPARQGDAQRIESILNDLAILAHVTIVDLDQRHAIETAYVRAATGLKLPDAAIIATARLAGATALIGNDRQWRNKPLGVAYHHMDDILALA